MRSFWRINLEKRIVHNCHSFFIVRLECPKECVSFLTDVKNQTHSVKNSKVALLTSRRFITMNLFFITTTQPDMDYLLCQNPDHILKYSNTFM